MVNPLLIDAERLHGASGRRLVASSHRRFLLLAAIGVGVLGLTSAGPALARRGRVRMAGRGLAPGVRYAGPTLSQPELRACLQQERSINDAVLALDREEQDLASAGARVNEYSQRSVDDYNRRVETFNARAQEANAMVARFNQYCANRAYYESDMRSVESELGIRR